MRKTMTKPKEPNIPFPKPSIPGMSAFTPNREMKSSATAMMPGHSLNVREGACADSGVVIGLYTFRPPELFQFYGVGEEATKQMKLRFESTA